MKYLLIAFLLMATSCNQSKTSIIENNEGLKMMGVFKARQHVYFDSLENASTRHKQTKSQKDLELVNRYNDSVQAMNDSVQHYYGVTMKSLYP